MIQRERKSGWYERFIEYVESAEEISTGRQRKCKLDQKTKKLFCVKGRLADSQKVHLRLGEGVFS